MWKRFEDEENAIVRAKEFLKNRSSTLHKKKVNKALSIYLRQPPHHVIQQHFCVIYV